MANNRSENQNNPKEVTFELMEHIGVLEERKDGWNKEVNIVAWNGGQPKVDIRDWDAQHERMGRGITLFDDAAEKLAAHLCKRYESTPLIPAVPAAAVATADTAVSAMQEGGQL